MSSKALLFFTLLCTGLFSSCMLATFDRTPGERLAEVPAEFQGVYKQIPSAEYKADLEDSTRLVLGNTWWEVKRIDSTERYYMGDSIVLSKLDNYYFISIKNYNRKYWHVFIAEKSAPDKIVLRPLLPQVGCYKIKKRLTVLTNTGEDVVYQMNEAALIRYYRKAIRKKPGFELIKEK